MPIPPVRKHVLQDPVDQLYLGQGYTETDAEETVDLRLGQCGFSGVMIGA